VLSKKKLRGSCKKIRINFRPHSPGKTLPERLPKGPAKQTVAITPGTGIKSWMELLINHPYLMNSHIEG
jgi:hypothetical protein